MSESSAAKPKVILEIGPGPRPFPYIGARGIQDNEMYIGLEKEPRKPSDVLEMARRNLDILDPTRQHTKLIQGNGADIPLVEKSVDEVVFGNVIGLPGNAEWIRLVREAVRVLRPDGRIVVIETISPSQAPEKKMKQLFGKLKFHPVKDPNYKGLHLVDQYNSTWRDEDPYDKQPYTLVFKKVGLVNRLANRFLGR